MKHKNDYSVVVFLENGQVKKWTYVHTLNSFANFLNQKHSDWKYFNVYNRRTAEYLQRVYRGAAIPAYL